ncbi:DNA-directed RNA polymerase subunit beta [Lihuaxuella thermophila]|uniref:DNA-directed RNA polymerase subunit beta n=1 Tax=Lihuaxuella thermophila TaxID=1173111 RepID=A0A1H8B989_9BACL|nr:DNA-directed RNA polymerase subunit beta [Lihuaxuella thermophila]SEM79266.1 DNA-directed RNA polymerase subunit beta [Lihuaxuella thermophila]
MSYPNKENRVDNHPEDMKSSPKQGEKMKSSLKELRKEQESRLPVGKLKWSKDEEEEQDTRANLEVKGIDPKLDHENEPVAEGELPASEGREKEAESSVRWNPQDGNGSSESTDREQSDQSRKETGQESPRRERALSLEDTLTPIDFKEYSIEPERETNKDPEFETEFKKPAYIVDEDDDELTEADSYGIPDEKKKIIKWAIKILWLPLLLFVVLIVGLIIGHTVIGDQPAGEIFDLDMWEHIYKLIYG